MVHTSPGFLPSGCEARPRAFIFSSPELLPASGPDHSGRPFERTPYLVVVPAMVGPVRVERGGMRMASRSKK
jgi:hypothetical protein